MSNVDQCPSSKKQGLPAQKERTDGDLSHATGRRFWRSLDDLANTPEFRERLEREFPAHASELSDDTRRDFLKLMAAGLALAGVIAIPGCRRPDHKILSYGKDPEDIIPGNPLYYATAIPVAGGGAQGLLACTFTGRPTKMEGNPLHPLNNGRTDTVAQATVLDLYDPDRSMEVAQQGEGGATADTFRRFAEGHFAKFDATRGRGLAILAQAAAGPSRDAVRSRLMTRWPEARWLPYETVDRANAAEGARIAFGRPVREVLSLSKAKRIVSIDRDFLGEQGAVAESRGFAAGRRVLPTKGDASHAEMNRLYAVESMMTLTGGAADHRLNARPSEIPGLALALAAAVLRKLGAESTLAGSISGASAEHADWIDAAAADLAEHRGESIVLVGESQPAAVHALMHAVNAALGAAGSIATYAPVREDEAASGVASIRALTDAINAGGVDTLVVVSANPVYDAPADLDFAAAYAKVPTTIHLGLYADETAAASTWHVNAAHPLESWGDAMAADGTLSVVQPTIAPLFDGLSEIEFLATIAGVESPDGYEIVRRVWRERTGLNEEGFERAWRRALHDGVLANSGSRGESVRPDAGRIAQAVRSTPAQTADGMQVLFLPHPYIHDGRFANNGWLQEAPHPVTKISWDNPALLSPATAERLGVKNGGTIEVSLGGRSIEIAAWIQPGLSDDTVVLHLGYGRTECGRVGKGTGFNVYPLRTSGSPVAAFGASVRAVSGAARGGAYATLLATTQDHGSMEGRDILREFDLAAFRAHGDEVVKGKDAYGIERQTTFAERVGMESHTPVNRNVYLPDQAHAYFVTGPEKDAEPSHPRTQQWAMSIDLTTCSGCGACTVACQAENNIPFVGKVEVWKGREMHWIRVDRYYSGVPGAPDSMVVQPVPCMHCENAPCEVVCPVNATIHGPEGTNDMAYNRCIGTRYCSNNCPYKVRRFNWFDYAVKQFDGGFGQVGEGLPEGLMPRNENFVPPRLRTKVSELKSMQHNPNVTVRNRGVMEKCTYCMQRINRARVESKLQDLKHIPDGFFQTACQQVCPTESIVFGDLTDHTSRIAFHREHPRTYMALAYLNTRPRTTYLARLRNPNPAIREPVVDPFHHGGHGEDHSPGHDDGHSAGGHGEGHANGRIMSLPVLSDPSRRRAMSTVLNGVLS